MLGFFLCILAVLTSFFQARRSVARGLTVVLFWGYFYGIVERTCRALPHILSLTAP